MSMVTAPSRGNSLGVWKMAVIVPSVPDEVLEFYLSNGQTGAQLKEDRPPGVSPLYAAPFPASFKLVKGMLRPFPRGAESRIMLVRTRGVGAGVGFGAGQWVCRAGVRRGVGGWVGVQQGRGSLPVQQARHVLDAEADEGLPPPPHPPLCRERRVQCCWR